MERKTDLRAATRLVIEWRPPDALFKPQPCFLGFPHLGRGREKAKRSRDSKPCAAKSSKGIRCNRSPPFTVTVTIPKVTELPRMIIRGKVNRNSQEDLRHTQQRPKYYHDAILVLTKLMCKPIQRFTHRLSGRKAAVYPFRGSEPTARTKGTFKGGQRLRSGFPEMPRIAPSTSHRMSARAKAGTVSMKTHVVDYQPTAKAKGIRFLDEPANFERGRFSTGARRL